MARNFYFENYQASMEQNLIEDLVIESIRIYGVDTWYMPRTIGAKDELLNEDDMPIFKDAYMVEMYVKSVDGFEGEGDFLSKFGLQIRDSMTLTVAIRTYDQEVGAYRTHDDTTRPMEGDLIYFPLNNKFFKVMHVEHEAIFYQMGSLQTYDLRCELFEYSNERFETGQDFIDDYFEQYRTFIGSDDFTFFVTVDSKTENHPYADMFDEPNFEQARAFYLDGKEAPVVNGQLGVPITFDLSDPSLSTNTEDGFTILSVTDKLISQGGEVLDENLEYIGTPGQPGAKVIFTPQFKGTYYYESVSPVSERWMGYEIVIDDLTYDVDVTDPLADNAEIESIADNILDFSAENPFGEDNF